MKTRKYTVPTCVLLRVSATCTQHLVKYNSQLILTFRLQLWQDSMFLIQHLSDITNADKSEQYRLLVYLNVGRWDLISGGPRTRTLSGPPVIGSPRVGAVTTLSGTHIQNHKWWLQANCCICVGPPDQDNYQTLFGVLDNCFLVAYAIGMFIRFVWFGCRVSGWMYGCVCYRVS